MRRIIGFLKLFRYDLLVMLAAMGHRDTPRRIKLLLLAAALYLVSPVDLIPDAIPLAGVMDDVLIVPAAVCGLTRLLPDHVRRDAEWKAERVSRYMPVFVIAASLVVLAWAALFLYGIYKLIAG